MTMVCCCCWPLWNRATTWGRVKMIHAYVAKPPGIKAPTISPSRSEGIADKPAKVAMMSVKMRPQFW